MASLTMGVASCSSEEETAIATSRPIAFVPSLTSFTFPTTRGEAVTKDNYATKMASVGVWGFYASGATGKDVTAGSMYVGYTSSTGIELANSNGVYDYANSADIKNWPATTAPLDFYAIHPYDAADTGEETVKPTITGDSQSVYFVNDGYPSYGGECLTDLMYATASGLTADSYNGTVPLEFRHALSQLTFRGVLADETLSVECEQISINNIGCEGTLSLSSGTWSGIDNITYYLTPQTKKSIASTTDTVTLIGDDHAFMLIPQTLTPWTTTSSNPVPITTADSNKQCYLSMSCKIKKDGEYVVGSDDEYGKVYMPFGTELGKMLEMGKKYEITLCFGLGYNEQGEKIEPSTTGPITYTVSVKDWSTTSVLITM